MSGFEFEFSMSPPSDKQLREMRKDMMRDHTKAIDTRVDPIEYLYAKGWRRFDLSLIDHSLDTTQVLEDIDPVKFNDLTIGRPCLLLSEDDDKITFTSSFVVMGNLSKADDPVSADESNANRCTFTFTKR